MPRRQLTNPNLPQPLGYSRAVSTSARELIFTSMTAPIDEQGVVVGDSANQQSLRCLVNIQTILELHGSSLDDVVKVTAYVTHEEDAAAVMHVIAETFSSPPPAIALAVIVALPNARFLVEIDAVAAVA